MCGGMRRAAQALLKLAWRPPDNVRLRARDGDDASTARSMRRVPPGLKVDIDLDPSARGRAAYRRWVSSMRRGQLSQGHPPPALPRTRGKGSSRQESFRSFPLPPPPLPDSYQCFDLQAVNKSAIDNNGWREHGILDSGGTECASGRAKLFPKNLVEQYNPPVKVEIASGHCRRARPSHAWSHRAV